MLEILVCNSRQTQCVGKISRFRCAEEDAVEPEGEAKFSREGATKETVRSVCRHCQHCQHCQLRASLALSSNLLLLPTHEGTVPPPHSGKRIGASPAKVNNFSTDEDKVIIIFKRFYSASILCLFVCMVQIWQLKCCPTNEGLFKFIEEKRIITLSSFVQTL